MKPWMHINDIDYITGLMQTSNIILEYGSGGSTSYFSKQCKKYYSIEHDYEWYKKIKLDTGKLSNVFLNYVPPDNNIKLPVWRGKKEDFQSYINFVKTLPENRYDIVIIDGRCRVDCAKSVIKFLDSNSLVLFHDFERTRYHSVLEYYNIQYISKNLPQLAALKLK